VAFTSKFEIVLILSFKPRKMQNPLNSFHTFKDFFMMGVHLISTFRHIIQIAHTTHITKVTIDLFY